MQQDRFERKQKLGEGAMGSTWLVYDRKLGVEWAMKSWKKEIPLSESSREETVIKTLQGSRFPRIVECFYENGRQFLVMDRIMGQTLEEHLQKEGPMAEEEAISLMLELCDTIQTLHESIPPILHLDIKPSNIMLTEDGVKLIDFGSALTGWHPGRAGSATYGYASPEQLEGNPVDVRSDIYSLGKVFAVMLSGKAPEERREQDRNRRNRRAKWFPKFPKAEQTAAQRVIERAVQKRPEQRFQSVWEMKNTLLYGEDDPENLLLYQIEKDILRTERSFRIG